MTPGMPRLSLAQQQRGMAQYTSQDVIEIQGNSASQLQGAIEFLLVDQCFGIGILFTGICGGRCRRWSGSRRRRRRLRTRGRVGRGRRKQLQYKPLTAFPVERTNGCRKPGHGAARHAKFQRRHRDRRFLAMSKKLLHSLAVFRRPNIRQWAFALDGFSKSS